MLARSTANEMIAVVQEELDLLERADKKAGQEESMPQGEDLSEEESRRLREHRLDRWLQQHTFSYSQVQDAAVRLRDILADLEDRPEASRTKRESDSYREAQEGDDDDRTNR